PDDGSAASPAGGRAQDALARWQQQACRREVILSMPFSCSLRRPSAHSLCAVVLLLAATLGEARAQNSMQGVPNAMQGFSQNRDKPIQIEAASLEVREKAKEATFAGNVKVVQGDTTMTSKSLVVFYDQSQGPEQPPPQPKQKAAKAAPGTPMQSATPGPSG